VCRNIFQWGEDTEQRGNSKREEKRGWEIYWTGPFWVSDRSKCQNRGLDNESWGTYFNVEPRDKTIGGLGGKGARDWREGKGKNKKQYRGMVSAETNQNVYSLGKKKNNLGDPPRGERREIEQKIRMKG